MLEVHQRIVGDGGARTLTTTYENDPFGNPTRTVDPLGRVTRITYDGLERRVRLEDPTVGTTRYEYDAAGKLLRQTDSSGRITHFAYDALGKLTRKVLPTGQVYTYTYGNDGSRNNVGRLIGSTDPAGAVELEYDPRGNVSQKRRITASVSLIVGYAYDSMQRLSKVTYPDGFEARYAYGRGGLVSRIEDASGRALVARINRTALGLRERIEYGNGVATSYEYDAQDQLRSLRTGSGRGAHQDLGQGSPHD
ncbi:MAG: hypothetical protein M3Y59_04095 [Myxococcota bacterium]|nr:hypothetical protein [Myxococcota bacterium]